MKKIIAIFIASIFFLTSFDVYANSFVFNPRTHTWKVYDASGNVIRQGIGSGGKAYCPDTGRRCKTPIGSFRVIGKRGADCKSSLYPIVRGRGGTILKRGGARMPYCTFFSKNFAIHGYAHVSASNQSHGCIRVPTSEAVWINRNLPIGSKVTVMSY